MKIILTADIHLSEKGEDQYRFDFLEHLVEVPVDAVLILGDFTDSKDFHSAKLVNLALQHLKDLCDSGKDVYLLQGNHCYRDPQYPYWEFLNELQLSQHGTIRYISSHERLMLGGKTIACFPHCETLVEDLENHEKADMAVMHLTVGGSIASNGFKLDGLSASWLSECFSETTWAFAGDIHVPQKVGPVEYVGSPYHVKFGDNYDPRYIIFDLKAETYTSVPYTASPKKSVLRVESLKELDKALKNLRENDRAKVEMFLPRSEFSMWESMKKDIQERFREKKVELHGCELKIERPEEKKEAKKESVTKVNPDVFQQYCKNEKLGKQTISIGKDILKQVGTAV